MKVMRFFLIAIASLLIIDSSASLEFSFEFTAKSSDPNNNNDLTTYSYLRDSHVPVDSKDIGIIKGTKTGSFNYLNKGKYIDYHEDYAYDYSGNKTEKSNITINHNMKLDFNGRKGISEFYGSHVFRNNRGISAWKKIRYDDASKYNLGKYMANNISVDANLDIQSYYGKSSSYELNYNATAKNAVADTRDAAGWANRTGSSRIDWEHSSYSHGNFSFRNDLSDSEPWPTFAGNEEDWLPCCFNDTIPEFGGSKYKNGTINWVPNKAVLKPALILPQNSCNMVRTVDKNGIISWERKCSAFSCINKTSCDGYECILTYDGEVESEEASSEFAKQISKYAKVNITQEYTVISGVETKYSITIGNTGTIEAKRLSLNLSLPQKMSEISPIEVTNRDIKYNINGSRVNITDLGDLNTGETMIIDLLLKHEVKQEVNLGNVIADLNYFALDERKAVQSNYATKREEGFSDNP